MYPGLQGTHDVLYTYTEYTVPRNQGIHGKLNQVRHCCLPYVYSFTFSFRPFISCCVISLYLGFSVCYYFFIRFGKFYTNKIYDRYMSLFHEDLSTFILSLLVCHYVCMSVCSSVKVSCTNFIQSTTKERYQIVKQFVNNS